MNRHMRHGLHQRRADIRKRSAVASNGRVSDGNASHQRTLTHHSGTKRSRGGITLLEVLLATAIFLGSLTAILQLMRLGHDSRISARLDAECALRCESLMGEYVAGMREVTSESQVPFDDSLNNEWTYTTSIEDGGGESLLMVTVLVEHRTTDEKMNAYFQLTRLMRDPQLFLDAALAAEEAEAEE